MVSRKLRNKTRRLRGGGGCGGFGCIPNAKVATSSVIEPSPINNTKKAITNLKNAARTQKAKNKANAKAQRKAEIAELKRQGEEKAAIYANSKTNSNGKKVSKEERDAAYKYYIVAYNQQITNNILTDRPLTDGLDRIIPVVTNANFN